jgi:hypothetical protein
MEIVARLSADDVDRIAAAVAERLGAAGPAGSGDQAGPGKIFWTEQQAAESLGISALTLKAWRLRNLIVASTSTRPILYSRQALQAAAEFLVSTRKAGEK